MWANRWMVVALTAGLSVCGCKKLAQLGGQAAEKAAEASGEQSAVSAGPALIQGAAPGPAGFQWQRTDASGAGSVEMPTGEGWTKEGSEAHNEKLDITAMVQVQPAVPPEARSQYLSSLIDVNKRDAPKYEVTGKAEGAVAKTVAGRVDGKFDNGTAYATRDYVLFAKGSAVALMVRGPVAKAADVQAVADHMAVSFQ
ncbi:MAG: hypothetical protein JW940_06475 [Polyangiaceae bacterium]|nr:hypothetical protein [Polyangiaceae bacterium]